MASGGRLSYLPPVDGLRAVAVTAVIVFHLWPGLLPGGFLGVDTFFVVSGYLITALLLAEHAQTGTVGLRGFWARRARRLLPALFLVLVATALAVAAWWPAEDLARVRADFLAGLGYVANWRFVASGESYFDLATGPSPLRHLWSLAIEEQFYVVWPLVALACLRRSGGARLLGAVCAVGAVASVAALVVVGPGDRGYFGTDTRAHALLVGALLAVALRPTRHGAPRPAPRWLAPAGTAALAACAVAWWVADETSTWLYRWGFPAYAALTALVVASVVLVGGSTVARALSAAPLVLVGKLSYGLYLWHWPAIVLLTETRTGLDGPALAALRLGVTVVGAGGSYLLVERPVRFGAALRGRMAAVATGGAFTGTAAVVLFATAGAAPVPEYLRAPTDRGAPVAAVSVAEPVAPSTTTAPPTTAPEAEAAPRVPRRPTRVVLVGDSVAWTFREELGEALTRRGVAYASAAIVGCGAAVGIDHTIGVVAGPDGSPHPWSYDCSAPTARIQSEALAAAQPDLVLFHSTWETADRLVGDRWVQAGTAEWEEVVRREIRVTTDRLTAGGARMAILTVPPSVDADLGPASAEENERRDRYDELLRDIVRRDPKRLVLIEFDELVCGWSRDACATQLGSVRLRPLDGIHFEDDGARWVAEKLADVVVSLDLDDPQAP